MDMKAKKETFRQFFIRMSKHVIEKKYYCYSSEFNQVFYDFLSREIENNLIVKLELYDLCCDVMSGKYKNKNINHLSLRHYNSDNFYFDFRLEMLLGNKFFVCGISKKNTYFICKYVLCYFKNVFLK